MSVEGAHFGSGRSPIKRRIVIQTASEALIGESGIICIWYLMKIIEEAKTKSTYLLEAWIHAYFNHRFLYAYSQNLLIMMRICSNEVYDQIGAAQIVIIAII